MTVTLSNTSGRLKTFTLPHESFCAARGRCACAMTPGRDPRRVPSSLTLAAKTRLEGVDEAVLAVPEIDQTVHAGELRVERKPSAPQRPVNPDPNNRRAGKRTRGDA